MSAYPKSMILRSIAKSLDDNNLSDASEDFDAILLNPGYPIFGLMSWKEMQNCIVNLTDPQGTATCHYGKNKVLQAEFILNRSSVTP